MEGAGDEEDRPALLSCQVARSALFSFLWLQGESGNALE